MAEEHFYYTVNMHGLEIRNHRMHLLATDPDTPNEGDLWFNTASHVARVRSNTATRNLFNPDDDFHNRLAVKATVVDADEVLISDSEDTYAYKKMTKANLVAGLGLVSKAYYRVIVDAGDTQLDAEGEDTIAIVGDGSVYRTLGAEGTVNTVTLQLINQNANRAFLGPATGGAATPTFRALVNGDMPSSYNPTNWDTAYTHSQDTDGNPHNLDISDLGYTIVTSIGDPGLNSNIPTEKSIRDFAAPKLLVIGSFIESHDARVTSNGTIITMSLEQSGGGNLTMQFSDGNTVLDCDPTPQTIELTAGSDAAPQANYIYIPQSTKVLTKSTSDWPTTEHIRVSYFFVSSATLVQSDGGSLVNQNWEDHMVGINGRGHILDISERIRREPASYFSGVAGSGTDDYTTSSASLVTVQCTSGIVYQLHAHTYAAKDTSGTDDIHIVNHDTTPYYSTQNLYSVVNDASGGTLNNRYFNIVLWGVINKTGEYSPMFVNLPTGTYTNLGNAQNDVDNYDVFGMPREFDLDSSTGFLIARLTFRKEGTSWTYQTDGTVDLRGQTPLTAGGGGIGGATTNFSDNQFTIYNVSDITKVINFDLSSLTTSTTRTIIPYDGNVTLVNYDGTTLYLDKIEELTTDNGILLGNVLTVDQLNSRVGIGVPSPAYDLDVAGAGRFSDPTAGQSLIGYGLIVNNNASALAIADFQVNTLTYNALFVDASDDSIVIMNNAAGKLGFFGVAATVRSTGWTITNHIATKILDANATTIDEICDVLGELITELKLKGILGG